MELYFNELKYLKNHDALIEKINVITSTLKDKGCSILEKPSSISNLHIHDDNLELNITITIPLSSE